MARWRKKQTISDIDLQSAKLAAMGRMAAGVAHEVNCPLTIISTSNRIILNELTSKKPIEKMDIDNLVKKSEIIQKSVKRIATIISGIKKFSRLNKKTKKSKQNFLNIISEVEALIDLTNTFRDVKMHVENNLDPNFEVECDEVEIEQVLFNLIHNAIDAASESSEKQVHILLESDPSRLNIEIKDSGKGLSEEDKLNIFTPFYTSKPLGKGTGLGLSIAKNIIENHNGQLYLKEISEQTCFCLSIPIIQSNT